MAANIPTLPVILTQADWNKKKGVVAKLVAVPTKIGEALANVEKAFKDVNWALALTVPPTTSKLVDVDNLIMKVRGASGTVTVLIDELKEAKTAADKAKADWDKNKLIPKDSKTHLENLSKAIVAFKTKVQSETQAAYKKMLETRAKIAAEKRPEDVKSQKEAMQSKDSTGQTINISSGVVVGKGGVKTEGIKTKFKPQPPAQPAKTPPTT